MTSAAEVPLLRLAAQRIAGPQLPSVVEAARWLTATQAQDLRGAQTSLALRTRGATSADVRAAFDAGEIVRSWPMRGTLHVVAAEDLGWMLTVAAGRIQSGLSARWRELALDDATAGKARDIAVAELTGGGRLTRDELFAWWQKHGIDTAGQRGVHLILGLALSSVVCFGPFDGDKQQLVLLDEWVPRPRVLDIDEALGEWALRFFRGHGPATVQDFARWTKLPLGRARAGLAAAEPSLERLDIDGTVHWMDPATPALLEACRSRARGVFLLPGFDEYVLGYADRSPIIPPAFAGRVVPGNNGVFQHTVVLDGQVVGTWKRAPKSSKKPLVATPFAADFPPRVATEIDRLAAELP
ncbi:MAG: hypothetical protein JWM93_911 [Frankiales bacterium]|nr:hypothetical protein [Frankiales bacterium]